MEELGKEGCLPPYMAYPRFLLATDLNETVRLIYDRVLERCVPVRVNNRSIRQENARANLERAKELLV